MPKAKAKLTRIAKEDERLSYNANALSYFWNFLKKIVIGLGWDVNKYDGGTDFDLDAAAFLLGENGKTASDAEFTQNRMSTKNMMTVNN